jgi:hypothetical protein
VGHQFSLAKYMRNNHGPRDREVSTVRIYNFPMSFAAAELASDSDAESSAVTKLFVVLPFMYSPECA